MSGAADRFIAMLDGLLGDIDAADGRFAAAAELEGRVSAPPLLSRTHYWHAWALAHRGTDTDRRRARALLVSAVDTASAIDQAGLERDARQLLESLGTMSSAERAGHEGQMQVVEPGSSE